jgi:hypothetical protein
MPRHAKSQSRHLEAAAPQTLQYYSSTLATLTRFLVSSPVQAQTTVAESSSNMTLQEQETDRSLNPGPCGPLLPVTLPFLLPNM